MRIGMLYPASGVAGDMFVGALVDAGVSIEPLQAAIRSLALGSVDARTERVQRGGLAATRFVVVAPEAPAAHRHLADILAILERAAVSGEVRASARSVFERLAVAEAHVHDIDVERVHFHEVGAVDTVVDVVCACLAVELLGLDALYSARVAVGSGTVVCEHGELPVPAPATARLLEGVPIVAGGSGERTTPTGAALLREFVRAFDPELAWVPERSGYGAGSRDDPGIPNLLRITVGTASRGAATAVTELSCNLDTASGETLAFLIQGALERGAVDAFATPIVMKKGRPAHQLTALVSPERGEEVSKFLLEESTTLGVRRHHVERDVLERWTERLATEWGDVEFKVTRLPSGRLARRAEDDEVSRICREHGVSRAEVRAKLATLPVDG